MKTFDQKCYDLAETFLRDNGITERGKVDELAGEIQGVIDDFVSAELFQARRKGRAEAYVRTR